MKKVTIKLLCLFILLNIFIILILFSFPQKSLIITGNIGNAGTIGLVILDLERSINITSPENITYNFSIGANYSLDLNVTADFDTDSWWYTLRDLRHNTIVYENISFTPNITFSAVRWNNKLIAYTNASIFGTIVNSSVEFYISVPNSAPLLGNISSDIIVCENDDLLYSFGATDIDEDSLTSDISPKNPFYVTSFSKINNTFSTAKIFSGILVKSRVGTYQENISISDGQYADSKSNINITVIEINNPPNVENIGVQTVWLQDNDTFYEEVDVTDVESGNRTSGNLNFNLTFLTGNKFFDINQDGVMNTTLNDSLIGVYNLSLCVTDLALETIHQNISYCGQDGLNQTSCQNFSLTITNDNRAPTIIDYYPLTLNFNISGNDNLFFNITEYDPDQTIPDAYWYVDDYFVEYDSGSLIDEFSYSFGCGVSGAHTIKVEITDGILNDTIQWNVSVELVACPVASGGGGGGGGRGPDCVVNWACQNWNVCQNIQSSLEAGLVSGEDYRLNLDSCSLEGLNDSSCGTQIRYCFDLRSCNRTINKPLEFQQCYYTDSPDCFDGIKNCHDGECELLIDCGGSCNPCSTCSDKIQNQGETDIDCGGPCPVACIVEKPYQNKFYITLFWLILIILIIILLIRIIRIVILRKELHKIDKKFKKINKFKKK